jgi:protein O-mannosyl-transferase
LLRKKNKLIKPLEIPRSLLRGSSFTSKNEKFNLNKDWIAFFTALFFIVHPLQTQSVTYIIQRMASMAAMFYILSIYLYSLGRLEHSQKNKISKAFIYYILAFISGILAVMTKENAATSPLAMLLFEFCFIRNKENKIYKNYLIISLFAYVSACIIYFILNPTILTSAATSGINISSMDYLINQFIVIVRYIQLTLLPVNQCCDYGNVNYNFPFVHSFWRIDVLGCLFILIGLIVLAVYLYKINKVLSFGLFWFFLTLSVESSIIPIPDPIFEHRMYLPMLGISLFLISSIFLLANKIKPIFIFSFLSLTIVIMGITCYSRNEIWKNDYTLWSDVVKKAPYNARGHYNKGLALSDMKKNEDAIICYNEAIKIKRDYIEAWNNEGNLLQVEGKYEESLSYFDEVINIKPDYSNAWYNKGISLTNLKKYKESVKCYDEAIKIKSDYIEALNNKGVSLAYLQKYEEAIKCYDVAVSIKNDFKQAWNNKGTSLFNLKKYDEAIECYDNALKININDNQAWNNKENALFHIGRFEEAIKNYEKSLELRADNYDAWNNKGSALFSLGRLEDAIKCFDRTLELKPDYQDAINNRNVALGKLMQSKK